jgi:hypothetical protein
MTTNRFILDESIITDLPKLDIVKIDKSYATFMYNNSDYKDYISVEYIEDKLSKDISAGILVNNILVAWGFTHDDGALGFLLGWNPAIFLYEKSALRLLTRQDSTKQFGLSYFFMVKSDKGWKALPDEI